MKQPQNHAVYRALFICLLALCMSNAAVSQTIVYTNNFTTSRTFVNISKPGGGTFNPNDTIEVRYTIYLPQSPQPVGGGGATQFRNILKSAKVVDTLPSNVKYVPNSLRILTNEGLLYKGPFSVAADADQGDSTFAGGNSIITIKARPNAGPMLDTLHGGFWARVSGTWTYQYNSSIPKWADAPLCMLTYRVKVTAAYGQFLAFNKSALWFKGTADAAPVAKFLYPKAVIAVYSTLGLCSNSISVSGIFENNGSFGTGKPQNRATSSTIVPGGATGYNFVSNGANDPVDGNYSIVNNSSALGSKDTTTNGGYAATRIFSVWDIFGDHTNAASIRYGNPPVDTAAAKPGGGYMLLVNASYATNTAVTQVVNNLCHNSYYEFAAWFRNICPKCSGDSLGIGAADPAYRTYPGNDSAGVRPNLSFEINDTTYYTSGDIKYTRTNPWIKKGFVFLNNLDSFRITIRNNSPGGGGNDWAIDDVTVSTCGPTLKMNYSPFVLGCSNIGPVVVTLRDTVRYAYNSSYNYAKWQRSINAGVTWTDIAGTTTGPNVTTLVNGQWQYVPTYTFVANGATDSGYRYRVIVATSLANLSSSSCAFSEPGNFTYLRFLNCGSTLLANLTSFTGKLAAGKANLSWTALSEKNLHHYDIERSDDGRNFFKTGEVTGLNLSQAMRYGFIDPIDINGTAYYRLKMVDNDGLYNYSNVVVLSSREIEFEIKYVSNPFSDKLKLDYIIPENNPVTLQIFDCYGKMVVNQVMPSVKGYNSQNIGSLDNFSRGMYVLKLTYQNNIISKKLVKLN